MAKKKSKMESKIAAREAAKVRPEEKTADDRIYYNMPAKKKVAKKKAKKKSK
jgi:hypothetical protein